MTIDAGLGVGQGTRGLGLWVASVVMLILAAIFVALRLKQRISIRKVQLDDWTIIIALACSIMLSITEIEAVKNGYGRHADELSNAQIIASRKWFYGAQIAYKMVLAFNKVAICCMYYNIFQLCSKGFRISCHIVLAIIIATSIAFILGTIFQCTPIRGFWNHEIAHHCINQTPWWGSYAGLQIVLDITLICLPVSQILPMQMSFVDKVGLIFVFCTGIFVTITSIVRATTILESATDPDPTYGPIPATIWSVIEANMGIIAGCLPLLRKPLLRIIEKAQKPFRRRRDSDDVQMIDNPQMQYGFNPNPCRSAHSTAEIRSYTPADDEILEDDSNDIYVRQYVSVTRSKAADGFSGV